MNRYKDELERELARAIRVDLHRGARRRRVVATGGVVAAASCATLLGTGRVGEGPPRTGIPALLQAADAAAAEREEVRRRYRYVRAIVRQAPSPDPHVQLQWTDAAWHGERRVDGRAEEVRPLPSGLTTVPVDELPTEPGALREELERLWVASLLDPDKPRTEADLRWQLLGDAAQILTVANASPELRAATFEMLARLPGVQTLGAVEDGRGRRGQGIRVDDGGDPAQVATLIVDPATGDLLETTIRRGEQDASTTLTFEDAGTVDAIGDTP